MTAQFFWFDWIFIFCNHSLICILFWCNMIKYQFFLNINRNCISIFVITFLIRMSNMFIRRHQVLISFIIILTKYKVQDSMYQKMMLDLWWQCETSKKKASHKQYCSVYIQLSHLQSLKNVQLLQFLTLSNINNHMYSLLWEKNYQLQQLAARMMLFNMNN